MKSARLPAAISRMLAIVLITGKIRQYGDRDLLHLGVDIPRESLGVLGCPSAIRWVISIVPIRSRLVCNEPDPFLRARRLPPSIDLWGKEGISKLIMGEDDEAVLVVVQPRPSSACRLC